MKMRLILALVLAALVASSGCKKKEEPQNEQPTGHIPQPPQPANPLASAGDPTDGRVGQPATPTPAPTPRPQSKTKGSLPGGNVLSTPATQTGFIIWGGDVPMFWGNGGLETREGTIFAQYGLHLKLVPGDNFEEQLTAYKAGTTPILRGEFGMIGKHVQKLCSESEDLCPVFFLMMTKSAGDHMVCREGVKTVSDLSGKTLALQKNGPHELFALQIVTDDAKLKWSDVKIEWTANLTGERKEEPATPTPDPTSPMSLLRTNPSVDCAFVVTPDMGALTGGLQSTGTGADKSIKGAHVVVSTALRRETIKDMYAVSAKFARENPEFLRSFAAAFLKSVEEVKQMANKYAASGEPNFEALLDFTTSTFALPNNDESFGLYSDATFVGHAGNVKFFDPADAVGITKFSQMAGDLAVALGTASEAVKMQGSPIDWGHAVFNGLASKSITAGPKLKVEATEAELKEMSEKGLVAGNTMLSYSATFDQDETVTDVTKYHKEFDQVIEASQRYTQAPVVIRGHADPTKLVAQIIRLGITNGEIQQSGTPGNFTYTYKGEVLTISGNKMAPFLDRLREPGYAVDTQGNSLGDWVQQADKTAQLRVETIKKGLLEYAKSKGTPLDESRIHTEAVGVREPFIVKARSPSESEKNRRVEFSLVKISVEAATQSDYEL